MLNDKASGSERARNSNGLAWPALVFSLLVGSSACSDQASSPGAAGASAAGAAAGGAANGGSAGAVSNVAGAPSGSTLDADCTTSCAVQSALDCSNGASCQTQCQAASAAAAHCQSAYDAMLHCDAALSAAEWQCSQDAAPVPVSGSCDSNVCAYACCVGALQADQDLWSRCMGSCPVDNGSGGSGGADSNPGSGGTGGDTSSNVSGAAGASGANTAGNPNTGPDVGPTPDAATRAKCTGTSPIVCHLGGAVGNYAVTAVVGGSAAASTEMQAEMFRLMTKPVVTAAGATQRYSFVVNVRTPEGQPVEDGPTEGTPGLDLYFYGSKGSPNETGASGATVAPQLTLLGFAPINNAVELYIAGDSTVCDQTSTAYSGWAQMLPASFDYPVSVANYADSGESAVSFERSAKMWGAINPLLKSGDWVLIQFGHNDSNDAAGAFHDNITTMVTQAKAKGAKPVLISPPARATFSGQTLSTQFAYGWGTVTTVMKQIASEQSVPYIDLTTTTTAWYNQLGPNGWQAYHAVSSTGTVDKTHTNRAGALAIAGFVAAAIKSQNITPLSTYLR